MLAIYLKTALRHLRNYKSAGIINIPGLSIGMAAAILIFMWVQNELNFDNYHPGADSIYHVSLKGVSDSHRFGGTPLLLADAAKKQMPEIEQSCRLVVARNNAPKLGINNSFFREKNLAYVDKAWFNVFHYDFIAGNTAGFSQNNNGIILTQTLAKKYYGSGNAIGQLIHIDSSIYQVEAVIKDNPVNSSFQFDIFLPIEAYLADNPLTIGSWLSFSDQTFFRIAKNGLPNKIEEKINNILLRQDNFRQLFTEGGKKDTVKAILEPIRTMHFADNMGYTQIVQGDKKAVYIFSILGFLLLAIACINYVNLTTAKASQRSKEVSIKKIMGAPRKTLFTQFLIESLVTSVIALLLTLLLVWLSLPLFNRFTEKNFAWTLLSVDTWKVLGGTLAVTFLLTGIYPAVLLSSFKPLNVLHGVNVLKIKNASFRKLLVTIQFTVTIILITSTIIILKQLHYISNNNEGYNRSQIFSVSIPSSWSKENPAINKGSFIPILKNELKQQTSIEQVAVSNDDIQNIKMSMGGIADWAGRKNGDEPLITPLCVDADFRKIFKLQLSEGRWFQEENTNDVHNYILNETAVAKLGLTKPYTGKYFSLFGDTGIVIGVAKDFHFRDYRQKIDAVVMLSNPQWKGTFFIQAPAQKIKQALAGAASTWQKFFPREPFEYNFMDEEFAKMYRSDIKTGNLVTVFSGIALFLSCLGLLGLVAFMAEQKRKEIGIRKVLGASVIRITTLLSTGFIKLVLLALIVATPVAAWAMNKWLEEFAYRIKIEWWMFAAAGAVAIFIALFSISFQAIKSATANPVKSLRTE